MTSQRKTTHAACLQYCDRPRECLNRRPCLHAKRTGGASKRSEIMAQNTASKAFNKKGQNAIATKHSAMCQCVVDTTCMLGSRQY